MEATSADELVKVDAGGRPLDGIVFERPSSSKVVVAVVDRGRGPVFRTFHPDTLSERPKRRRRSPAAAPHPPHATTGHGSARGGAASEPGRAGHRRAAQHRTTGKVVGDAIMMAS